MQHREREMKFRNGKKGSVGGGAVVPERERESGSVGVVRLGFMASEVRESCALLEMVLRPPN